MLPHLYDWYYQHFYQTLFYSGRIDRRVVELVRLRLANIHGCAFCNRNDRIAALDAGIPDAEIDAIADYENGPFSEAEKASLALADVMVLTNQKGHVTKALYERLKGYFTEAQLVELGMIMAVLCGMAKFIFAYDLVEKEDSCPFIPAAPNGSTTNPGASALVRFAMKSRWLFVRNGSIRELELRLWTNAL